MLILSRRVIQAAIQRRASPETEQTSPSVSHEVLWSAMRFRIRF